MLEVVDVAEELIVQLRIGDNRHGTVLQSGTGVHTSCMCTLDALVLCVVHTYIGSTYIGTHYAVCK